MMKNSAEPLNSPAPETVSLRQPKLWDTVGIFFSGLCVVHCLLIPILLVVAPSAGAVWLQGQDPVHRLLFSAVLGVAGVAFVLGYRVHRSLEPVAWMLAGLTLVLFGTFWGHEYFGVFSEYILVPMGGLILIRAHFLNRAHCRACEEHHSCPAQKLTGGGAR